MKKQAEDEEEGKNCRIARQRADEEEAGERVALTVPIRRVSRLPWLRKGRPADGGGSEKRAGCMPKEESQMETITSPTSA